MSEPLILSIDQGTTGTTAMLLDRRGEVRARGYAELPQHFPRPGWVEHHGEEIWETSLSAVDEACGSVEGGARSVAAIGITNQRETTLLWDRESGAPVTPAIVWQDRRTAERCAQFERIGLGPPVRERTGLVLDPYFSATKLEWMLRHVEGLMSRARQGRLAFGTVDSWLLWKLTGGAVHATEPTNASRTLLYDIGRRHWDERQLEMFGVPAELLPEVRPSSGVFGTTRGVGALPDGIPIAGIAGDQQAALFGQGCVEPGQSKNTYGTGCFLLMHTGERRVASRSGLITTIACGPGGEPAYALEGSVFIAGAALQWLRDGLEILESAPASAAIAAALPDAGGVVLVPAFVGLGAPYWRPEARGALFGLTRGTTRAHLVRAALESLAFQSRDLMEAMASDAVEAEAPRKGSGHERTPRVRALRVDGGAAANDWLMQYQADLLGLPVERPRVIETTALGSGLLAGLAVGFWESHRDLDQARGIERVFEPRQTDGWRAAEYRRWQRAVAALLAMEE